MLKNKTLNCRRKCLSFKKYLAHHTTFEKQDIKYEENKTTLGLLSK